MDRPFDRRAAAPLARGFLLGREAAAESGRFRPGFAVAHGAGSAPPTADGLITYRGDGHIITIAPTGTGKTAGPVICNALVHPGQLIAIDIKGEVSRVTARRRRELGQDVHIINLGDTGTEASASLNPLDLALRGGSDVVSVARSFAANFIERSGHERDRFWNDWAENLLTAGVIWLLADQPEGDRSIARLYDLLTEDDAVYAIATLLDTKKIAHPAAVAGFGAFLQLPERETRPAVLGTLLQHLRFFDSPVIRRATATTSIDLDGLIAGKPMTLYVVVPPMRLTAYRLLLRAWLTGLLFCLTERVAVPEHRTLLLCDEIASLGRIDAFLTASTLMRGWGITLWSFWQNLAQLELYGDQARTLIDNAGVLQFFGARNRRMAEDFSALVGGIDAGAIMALGREEQLLIVDGAVIERSSALRYYRDPLFCGLYDDGQLKGSPAAR